MKNPILKLALPNILSNISVPLVGMVDLALMGHMDSEIHLNAIAIGGSIFSFIYMSFGFLRMSTTGFVAQAHGQNNSNQIVQVFSRSMMVAFSVALVLMSLQIPIGKLGVNLLGASEAINSEALKYFHIRIFAAPATLGLYAIMGWFIGRQDTRTPLYLALLINIGNILFNIIFVFGLDMKSEGVAWGTLIAQYIGFTTGLFVLIKRSKPMWKNWTLIEMLESSELKKFFGVNRDIFIRTILLLVSLTFFTASSARMGQEILAINTLLFQFFLFFTYFIDGFANAAEALVGKHIGEDKHASLKPLVYKIFTWGFFISLPFSLLYFLFGSQIMGILTDLPHLIQSAQPYFIWIGIMPIISFAAFIWDGVYIGATEAVPMRNSMIVSSLFVFFPLFFVLYPLFGNHGLWFAFIAFLMSRGLFLHWISKKYIFK
ncbi:MULTISPECIES: MATE family efflux transporter [unclassified Lentimicrobium]|uniref:MATE family efflux transporter n=1 Tax=unclassified Lentimicrobium TaxID=2677434 RepID=UPI001552518A|nr:MULTISPECIES: MATE family efflux transporter [unclassified Lentimicrobium]NPD44935.1 MATE family efflux transporter [Lentimicrobium sp. S6]NPD85870.1 MATE family efflux transporter [Lentimicrobium sp. L6]